MRIKALFLTQPWATYVAEGHKTIETRRWRTSYRGFLLICAAKAEVRDVDRTSGRMRHFPSGVALAVCELIDCRPMTIDDEEAACCGLYEGAWAWVLRDVRPVDPFPVRGFPGLFDVDDELVAAHMEPD